MDSLTIRSRASLSSFSMMTVPPVSFTVLTSYRRRSYRTGLVTAHTQNSKYLYCGKPTLRTRSLKRASERSGSINGSRSK
jgi:hypothetical protein